MPSGLRTAVPAGLVDAAAASLATFATGLFAARIFDPESLGVYALFFSGFMLSFTVPDHLLFQPAEVATLAYPPERRLLPLPQTVAVGSAMSVVSATIGMGLCVLLAPDVGTSIVGPLAITAGVTAFVWPLQDHLRQMLHMAGRSEVAAGMSIVNAVVVIAVLATAYGAAAVAAWLPFGALTVGNIASLLLGLQAWRRAARGDEEPVRLAIPTVVRAGRFYLASGAAPIAAAFLVSVIVTRLAGAAALGYAEAARVVAQPVAVIGVGLTATIGPRLMEAGAARDRVEGRRLARLFLTIVGGSGLVAIAAFGWQWSFNPMAWLLPQAYVVPWLVTVTIVANVLSKAPNPSRAQLLGADRERRVAKIDAVTALVQCVVAGSAVVTGAMARPLALAGQAGLQWPWLRVAALELFSTTGPHGTPPAAPGGQPTRPGGRYHRDG